MSATRRTTATLALAATVGLIVAGCSQPAESGGGGDGEEQDRVSTMSIVTGGTAGVYYPIGGALSGIIDDHVEGTSASVEATGASVENIRLIASGSADIAVTQGDAADQAYNGTGDFDGEEPIETKAIAVLYPNVYHTVTLASIQNRLGLECFSDIEGHRYSVGDVGSGNEATTNQVFESLGLDVTSDITRSQLGYAETTNALTSGGLDAGSWVVGEGHGGINELAATDDVALVPMCEDEITAITEGDGGYTAHTIPGGTYSGVDEDVETIAVWNVLVVPADFNEEQAYELTEAIFDNVDAITDVYAPAADYLTFDNVENAPVPFHPGAVRYFQDNDVEVPEDLQG
ncbi:TAXI family TRAP transporter solute-binding subunit [Citricoccus muralis]|uniref:TAXI family TRAP transporter solute-binding subunit n=1 Tax=Citricoccus muralis TaxID=169134 RepID=A0ABY8H4N4_9MICC|nr:TAXI family TRAP transporter solute-binding subunit [Citricoccus muralis]WFP15613.1 TAXI family TRAP transporter solute-binding subunit [Citricoccus muralis]